LVAGSVSSGIFVVTAYMARDLGSAAWILVTWLSTGLLTIGNFVSYGELAGMMPTAGGQYVYSVLMEVVSNFLYTVGRFYSSLG
jgi:APA family basic amino acid/polyamine antiporter